MEKEKKGNPFITKRKRALSYLAEIVVGVFILVAFFFILMMALH